MGIRLDILGEHVARRIEERRVQVSQTGRRERDDRDAGLRRHLDCRRLGGARREEAAPFQRRRPHARGAELPPEVAHSRPERIRRVAETDPIARPAPVPHGLRPGRAAAATSRDADAGTDDEPRPHRGSPSTTRYRPRVPNTRPETR
jgi:hypothetical protein